jgi:hypothetical protein
MDYLSDDKDFRKRAPFRPIFWILPLIFSSLIILTLIIVRAVRGSAGGSWGRVFWWSFFAEFVCWGLSIMVYLLSSISDLKSSDREFNSPKRCDELLRGYIVSDTGYVLDDFSKTAESIVGSKWAGKGDVKEQEHVYFHLYRARIGALNRYLLAVINMDKVKEDSYIFKQSPSNFQNITKEIDDLSDQLCINRKQTVTRERVYRDEISGRSETVKEESPLDQSENGVDEDGA